MSSKHDGEMAVPTSRSVVMVFDGGGHGSSFYLPALVSDRMALRPAGPFLPAQAGRTSR